MAIKVVAQQVFQSPSQSGSGISGTVMIMAVSDYDCPAPANSSISVPFVNAKDEHDAVRQSLEKFVTLAKQFLAGAQDALQDHPAGSA